VLGVDIDTKYIKNITETKFIVYINILGMQLNLKIIEKAIKAFTQNATISMPRAIVN